MLKVFATDVVISKGFDGAPALRFSETGESVRFRFGKKVYDTHAENNTRWVNMTVKAFGTVCERIKKMKLKEGSFVNLIGRLDEDTWIDQNTNETKSMMVIILDEIEYAAGGGNKPKENQTDPEQSQQQNAADPSSAQSQSGSQQLPENFTGFEPFGGASFFDEN